MIKTLIIKNLATIADLQLQLPEQFTVITGETGAGKSILIDALYIALGGRAPQNIVRENAQKCEICIEVEIYDKTTINWLQANDLESDALCQVRRIIQANGKSRAYINGKLVPLYLLKELGQKLIKIHSQHQYMDLLSQDAQLTLIDRFAKNDSLLQQLHTIYNKLKTTTDSLNKKLTAKQELLQSQQLLTYQLAELNELSPLENEWEDLQQEHQLLSNAQEIISECHQLTEIHFEQENNTILNLHHASETLKKFNNNKIFNNCIELFEQAKISLEEAKHELNNAVDAIDCSPERLKETDARLSLYFDIARKHNVAPEYLYTHLQDLQNKISEYNISDADIENLKKQQSRLQKEYLKYAKDLSKQRKQHAKKLNEKITKLMRLLGIQYGEFIIEFTEYLDNFHPKGIDCIEFFVKTNLGQAAQPLRKIASGGELSRISLALEVITSEQYAIPCLVFDEVDVGIGGATLNEVSNLLEQLGKKRQILCITHQGPLAARGTHHMYVEKTHGKNQSFTSIKTLDNKSRQLEIARMLSGNTEAAAVKHAKKLLAGA